MTLSLHAVKHAIPSTPTDTLSMEAQILRQHSNCERNRLIFFYPSHRSWSRDLDRKRIVVRPPPRIFKLVESCSPYIEHTNLSCENTLVTRAATYGHPCLTTHYSTTLFNSKEKNWKDKHRKSSIVRCETEWRGQSEKSSEQIPAHEGHEHCGKRKCKGDHPHSEHEHGVRECKEGQRDMLHKSDHTPDQRECEHEHCDQLPEWKGMKDAYSECARRHEAGHDQHHEGSEWKGREDLHPEYPPRHGEPKDELGHVSSSLRVAKKGYIIKVSKELMGLFCYIEKRKRSMIKELAHTLRQVAAVALTLTCVRGILAPLVEVFKTTPPTWSKLLLMLVSLDSGHLLPDHEIGGAVGAAGQSSHGEPSRRDGGGGERGGDGREHRRGADAAGEAAAQHGHVRDGVADGAGDGDGDADEGPGLRRQLLQSCAHLVAGSLDLVEALMENKSTPTGGGWYPHRTEKI